jgi:hypothetical protein
MIAGSISRGGKQTTWSPLTCFSKVRRVQNQRMVSGMVASSTSPHFRFGIQFQVSGDEEDGREK